MEAVEVWMPIAVLFGLLAFSIFRGSFIIHLAIAGCSAFMALSGHYEVWLAFVFLLVGTTSIIKIIRGGVEWA